MNITGTQLYKRLYKNRFEIFLTTQLFILFGGLFFPIAFFEKTILPILFEYRKPPSLTVVMF